MMMKMMLVRDSSPEDALPSVSSDNSPDEDSVSEPIPDSFELIFAGFASAGSMDQETRDNELTAAAEIQGLCRK